MVRHVVVAVLLFASTFCGDAEASIIKAKELQRLCMNIEKGKLGESFDESAAATCRGYLAGFFDTMIILEEVRKTRYFCVPDAIPKESNTRILDAWVASNGELANDTTAAVAMLSAYQKAFKCKK